MLTGIILLVIIIAIGLWFVSCQRELVKLDENANNALSSIDVQCQSRWDALTNIAGAIAQYDEHESKTLQETIAARRGTVKTAADANAQEAQFGQVMAQVNAVAEAYPQLQAAGLYQEAMASIKTYEENVRMSRMIFNDNATKINRYVRQWPSSIVAGILHFDQREYLKIEEEEQKRAPQMFPNHSQAPATPQQ